MARPTPTEIKCKIVQKTLRHRVVGSKNRTIDAVVNVALPDYLQGEGRQLLENEMLPHNEAGFVRYGGQRDAITIEDPSKAVEFLESNEAEVPFGFQ
jgi:hypothetical protein